MVVWHLRIILILEMGMVCKRIECTAWWVALMWSYLSSFFGWTLRQCTIKFTQDLDYDFMP